jgi:hypothetical protein
VAGGLLERGGDREQVPVGLIASSSHSAVTGEA